MENNHHPQAESVLLDVAKEIRLRALLRSGGAGVPFLFVHGLASNARLWDGVATLVAAAGHDSVAVDLRGHGESTQVDSGFDFGTLAADLAAVIDQTSARSVIAVGQSWGANVVLELAARHQERVAAVSLIDGGFLRLQDHLPHWPEAQRLLTPPSFDGMTMESMATTMRSHLDGFPEPGIEAQLANFTVNEDGSIRNHLSLANHLIILRHLWDHDPDPVGARVASPVQVIAVQGGAPSKPERVASFTEATHAEVHWMDGHHDVHAQQPERVTELLLDLADRVSR